MESFSAAQRAVAEAMGLVTITLPPWLLAMSYAFLGWSVGLGFTREILIHASRALPQILRLLDDADLYVDDLALTHPTLDDVFIKHTGEHIREDAPVQNWRNQRGPLGRGGWE